MKTKNSVNPRASLMSKLSLAMFRTACLLSLVTLTGCAAQYHAYPCGKVSCTYCPPNPLPNSSCESCNCNDSIGQFYAATLSTSNNVEATAVNFSSSDYVILDPDQKRDPRDQ